MSMDGGGGLPPRGRRSRRTPRASQRSPRSISGRCRTNIGNLQPLWKYSWPNGEQVYVSQSIRRGRAVHDDGVAARRLCRADPALALLHAAPKERARSGAASSSGPRASAPSPRCSAWSSASGCIRRRKRYRYDGAPTGIPVSRPETLAHGARADLRRRDRHVGVQRHAVDGTVPAADRRRGDGPREAVGRTHSAVAARATGVCGVLRRRTRARRWPSSEISRSRSWSSRRWPDEPVYMATIGGGDTRIVPVDGRADRGTFDQQRIIDVVSAGRGAGRRLSETQRARRSTTRTTSIAAESGRCQ